MKMKEIPKMIVKAVMSLYKKATTKIKVGFGYSDKFSVKVGVDQGSVLSPFLFAPAIDVATKEVRKGLFHEILYADDLVLISDFIEGIQRKFANWKDS